MSAIVTPRLIVPAPPPGHHVTLGTIWEFRAYRPEPEGRRVLLWEEIIRNKIPTVGLNKVLDATFKTGLASPAWYIGLINNAGFSAFAAGDTMASHAGWAETSAYNEATRRTLTLGTIASGSVDNAASPATFTMTSALTLMGGFLVDNSTKGGSTGTVFAEAAFQEGNRAVDVGTVVTVTVTLLATSAT